MMGLRTQFVHLWVCDQTEKSNDTFEDYGLFTQVEQLNKTALKAHGLDKSGHLYKVNSLISIASKIPLSWRMTPTITRRRLRACSRSRAIRTIPS